MFCKRCGKEFGGGDCPHCGQVDAGGSGGATQAARTIEEQASSVFLEADEVLKAQLSRGYISEFLLEGTLGSDYVILSDRRVYYSGTYIGRIGARFGKFTGVSVLPLEKVTSISFVKRNNVFALIAAWLLLLTLGTLMIAILVEEEALAALFLLFPSLVLFVIYFLTRSRLLVIASNSAEVPIKFKLYGENAIRKFAHTLGMVLTEFRKQERRR